MVWESALPIRAAELKAGLIELPGVASEGYSIAVYGIPGSPFNEDPAKLGAPLRKAAFLRRSGREDVRPSSVEVPPASRWLGSCLSVSALGGADEARRADPVSRSHRTRPCGAVF